MNNSLRTGTRTLPLFHTSPQHNIRPFPPFYLQTETQRKARKLSLSTKSPRRKMPPRICRRGPYQGHIYSFYDQPRHSKRTPDGNPNSAASPPIRTQRRKRPRESKSNKLPTQSVPLTCIGTNIQHYFHPKEQRSYPKTTTTHTESPDPKTHYQSKSLPTLRTTILNRALASVPRKKSRV